MIYLFENLISERLKLMVKSLLYSAIWVLTLTSGFDGKYAQADQLNAGCATLPSIVFKAELQELTIALAERCYQEGDDFAHSYLQSLYLAHITNISEDNQGALMGPDGAHSPESYLKALLIRMLSTNSRPAYGDHFYRQEYLRKAVEGEVRFAKILAVYRSLANRSTNELKVELPEDMEKAHREAIEYFGDGCTQIRFSVERNDEFLGKYWQVPEYPQMLANHVKENCGYAIDFAERNDLKPQVVGEFFFTMSRLVFEQSHGLGDSRQELKKMTAKEASENPSPEVVHWLKKYKENGAESPLDWCDQYFPGKRNLCYRVAFMDHFTCMSALSMPSIYDVRHSAEYDLCRAGAIAKFKNALLD